MLDFNDDDKMGDGVVSARCHDAAEVLPAAATASEDANVALLPKARTSDSYEGCCCLDGVGRRRVNRREYCKYELELSFTFKGSSWPADDDRRSGRLELRKEPGADIKRHHGLLLPLRGRATADWHCDSVFGDG